MRDNLSNADYRERLKTGGTVYLIDGEDAMGGGTLTIKKGTLDASDEKRYPTVMLWTTLNSGEGVTGLTKSPRELFTADEVIETIEARDPSVLPVSPDLLDTLLEDSICRRDVVAVLGQEVIARLADDELAHPGDPER